MPGASLRNAIPQRPYRERAQPKSREKLGILEKHKDYSARARDYNAKKARLRALRQKAAERNPDEFHFAMVGGRTKGGVRVAERGGKVLGGEVVKLMKTQDAGYLRVVRGRVRRERERLEGMVVLGDGEGGGRARAFGAPAEEEVGSHTVFVDDEVEQKEFDPEQWFGTDEKGLGATYNRPRRSSGPMVDDEAELEAAKPLQHRSPREREAEHQAWKEEQNRLKKAKHDQHYRTTRLAALKDQEAALLAAEEALDRQRAKMANTVGGVNKKGVKFKHKERKR